MSHGAELRANQVGYNCDAPIGTEFDNERLMKMLIERAGVFGVAADCCLNNVHVFGIFNRWLDGLERSVSRPVAR